MTHEGKKPFNVKTVVCTTLKVVLAILLLLVLTYVLLYMIGGKLLIVRLSLALNLPDWLLMLLWGWF